MLPIKKNVQELANTILAALRELPNIPCLPNGLALFMYTTDKTIHSSVLQYHVMADNSIFKDALTYLMVDDYISIVEEVITLLPKGRKFCIDGGYDYGQNERLPEFEFIEKDGLFVPKPKDNSASIRYKPLLSFEHKKSLLKFLKKYNLVNDPKKFVEFLNGENDGEDIEINEYNESLTAITLLLKELRNRNLIELTIGNEFQQYFASHIRPFSLHKGKKQIERFKKEIRKATNKKWNDCPIAKDLVHTISTFIIAGLTVFVIPLT